MNTEGLIIFIYYLFIIIFVYTVMLNFGVLGFYQKGLQAFVIFQYFFR